MRAYARSRKVIVVAFGLASASCVGNSDAATEIEALQRYAERYEACGGEMVCWSPGDASQEVLDALESHPVNEVFTRSVMLVLLKLFACEFSEFHQGYDLRTPIWRFWEPQNPWVTAYKRIDEGFVGGDHMTAEVAFDWVQAHPAYLDDPMFAEQMRVIAAAQREMEEQYRKSKSDEELREGSR